MNYCIQTYTHRYIYISKVCQNDQQALKREDMHKYSFSFFFCDDYDLSCGEIKNEYI